MQAVVEILCLVLFQEQKKKERCEDSEKLLGRKDWSGNDLVNADTNY